jgi:hypothetical protein
MSGRSGCISGGMGISGRRLFGSVAIVCFSAKQALESSLPEENLKEDAERNNDTAEAEDQDVANIMSGDARASLSRRDDRSVYSIISCH